MSALQQRAKKYKNLLAEMVEFGRELDEAIKDSSSPDTSESAFNWAPGERERLGLKPIRHQDIWEVRKTIEGLHWTAQEVNFDADQRDWRDRMSPDQKHYVKMQLGFFAYADIDVVQGLDDVCAGVDCLEAQMAYAAQKDQECAHAESYALQIDALLTGAERQETINMVQSLTVLAKMRAWAQRCFDRKLPIGERLVAFAVVEGVLFSSSFAAFQWLRELNLLPGITQLNDFISRDEGIHCGFSCLLLRKYIRRRPPQSQVHAIFAEAVEIVDNFVKEALPVKLIGMNCELMIQYVHYQADVVLASMAYRTSWYVENPLPFMDKQALNKTAKTNFFELVPTQYQNVTKPEQSRFAVDKSPVV
jgi:ribonucleotide reductase beta subunit family protein with ferritin-like domain